MRLFTAAFTISATLLLTGCASVLWLNPVVPAEKAVFEPAIDGIWADDDDTFVVRQDGDGYRITCRDSDGTATKFSARLYRVSHALLLDVVADDKRAFYVPAHFLVRVWTGSDRLQFAFVDSEWLRAQVAAVAHIQKRNDQVLITDVVDREVALALAADDRAHGEVATLERVR